MKDIPLMKVKYGIFLFAQSVAYSLHLSVHNTAFHDHIGQKICALVFHIDFR